MIRSTDEVQAGDRVKILWPDLAGYEAVVKTVWPVGIIVVLNPEKQSLPRNRTWMLNPRGMLEVYLKPGEWEVFGGRLILT